MFKGGHREFGSYITPEDSPYYSDKYFLYASFFSPVLQFIGGGDFNNRVGDVSHVPPLSGARYRENPDVNVNSHGKMVKKVCKACNVYVVNNLSIGDKTFDGNFTFSKGGRRSQNDLCLSNVAGLKDIESFTIHDMHLNFSDHWPISLCCNMVVKEESLAKLVSTYLLSQSGERVPKRRTKIQNEDINWEAFQNSANINLLQIQNNLHNYDLRNQETLDKVFNQLESSIYNTALQCRSIHSVDNPEQPCTTTDVNDIHAIKERITNNEIRKWNKILSSKDPKELWNEIEWKEKSGFEEIQYPPAEQLGNHFKGKVKHYGGLIFFSR